MFHPLYDITNCSVIGERTQLMVFAINLGKLKRQVHSKHNMVLEFASNKFLYFQDNKDFIIEP